MGSGLGAAGLALGSAAMMAVSNVLVRVAERACRVVTARAGGTAAAAAALPLPAVLWWTTAINAAVLAGAWVLVRALGHPPGPALPGRLATWAALIAGGLLGQYLGRIVLYDGLRRHGPGWIAAGKAATPLFAALLAVPVLGQRPSPSVWLAVALITLGTALTGTVEGRHRARALVGLRSGLAAGALLGASLVARGVAVGDWPDPLGAALIGALATWALLAVGRSPSSLAALPAAARRAVWASGACSAAALALQLAALRGADVAVVGALVHTEPVLALAVAHVALGGADRVPPRAVLGACVVAAGVLCL